MITTETALIIGVGILIIGAIVTAPLWLPNDKPKKCGCGVEVTPRGIRPYCECEY